ncbi:DUF881 domain-containing protein [Sporosarcina sp. Sa3CUA8]|uniref:DUF881 domain-containing protein n=2 Tax=Sporosarcina gallistercoris TaxID=2762245 RepID=A0ABR8PGA9_9BACL|nr:DUF881 domain-containing protein [Sporosarcina gallistercoris]
MSLRTSDRRKRNNRISYALVFLVLGFIFSFSYRTLGPGSETQQLRSGIDSKEEGFREELIEQKERNKQLTDEITSKQKAIAEVEQTLSDTEENHDSLVKEARSLRLLLGVVPASGQGVRVELADGDYDPAKQNPNEYIVHESQVLMVVNELKIAGAQALSINGQRLNANSSIKCTGPVITIDGQTYPAPFVVEAIGDSDALHSSLTLKGGVMDSLLLDNIEMKIEKQKEIIMPALRDDIQG